MTINDGMNDIDLMGIDDAHIESIIVNSNTTFTLVSVSDQTACAGIVVGNPVTINVSTPPTAEITGDVSLCGSSTVPLNFNLTGTGPFDVTYSSGMGSVTLTAISDGHAEMVTPTGDETFVIESVVDANGCEGTFSGDAVIDFYEELEIINLSENCTFAQDAYIVSFEIIGGEAASYAVNGGSGNLVGNVFTSDEISSNTPYSFTVSDNSTCPSVDVLGVHNCQCLTDPGTMATSLFEYCVTGTVDGTSFHNNDATLEANDLLQYALHDNASNSLGTIFAINATPIFVMMPGMIPGTTYYVSPIVGPDNGSGSIDMGHLCFGVGVGTPIVFHALPQAMISGDAAICSGEAVTLTFNFTTGMPPFDLTYTDGINSVDLEDITDGHTVTVNPTNNTTFSIVSVQDNTAATCEGFGSGIATVDIHEVPLVTNVIHTCNSTNTEYHVSFEISGGDAATYAVTGGAGTLDNTTNIFTSDWMPNGSPYTFAVDDVNACGPTLELGNHVCDCTTETVDMSDETLLVCEDETAIGTYTGTEVLDGDDVFGFVLHDLAGDLIGTVFATNSIPEFTFLPSLTHGTTYYISAIAGNDDGSGFPVLDATLDPCLAIAPGQPVIFTELPTASIMGTASVCEGTSTDLTFNFTGTGPFDVVYTDGTNSINLVNILDGHIETVEPIADVSYSIVSINRSSAPNCNGSIDPSTADITIIDIPEVQNVVVNCNVAGTDYRVTFEIVGGDVSNYFVDGDPGTLSGNVFTSNWMQSGSNFNYEISDGTICDPVVISDIGLCNCTPDIQPNIQVDQSISCPGDANGVLSVTNINGVPPFNFEWSNGGVGAIQDGLNRGMYHVTMTDGNGCISVDSIFMTDPDSITAELFVEPVTCYGENDGTLTVANITGGAGDYTFEINPVSSFIENEYFKLTAGTYTVTISDGLGCTAVQDAVVEEPEPIVVDLSLIHI